MNQGIHLVLYLFFFQNPNTLKESAENIPKRGRCTLLIHQLVEYSWQTKACRIWLENCPKPLWQLDWKIKKKHRGSKYSVTNYRSGLRPARDLTLCPHYLPHKSRHRHGLGMMHRARQSRDLLGWLKTVSLESGLYMELCTQKTDCFGEIYSEFLWKWTIILFFFNSRSQGRAEKLALGFHSAPCIVCSQLSYQGWRLSYFFAVGEWRGSHSMTTAAALWSAYSELVYMHSTHIACIWPRCMTCTPHVSHASLHKISTTRTGVNFVLSKLGETKLMVASSVFGGLDPKAFT